MALTFLEMQDETLALIDSDDTDTRTHVKNFLNRSANEIWRAWPARERRKEAILSTLAPYSTGTVSISVASSTVTGSGTTFPSTYTTGLAKFATGYAAPWYYVATRDSGTQLTLAGTSIWADAALSGSTYALWQDTYNLESDVDTLIEVRLLSTGNDGPIAITSEARLDEVAYHPRWSGFPRACAMVPQSSAGLKRIRIWPAPDATYRLSYRYLKAYTDMSADGDECVVPEEWRDIIVCGALRWAYRLKGQYQKAIQEDGRFRQSLRDVMKGAADVSPLPGRIRGFDEPSRTRDRWDYSSIVLS